MVQDLQRGQRHGSQSRKVRHWSNIGIYLLVVGSVSKLGPRVFGTSNVRTHGVLMQFIFPFCYHYHSIDSGENEDLTLLGIYININSTANTKSLFMCINWIYISAPSIFFIMQNLPPPFFLLQIWPLTL